MHIWNGCYGLLRSGKIVPNGISVNVMVAAESVLVTGGIPPHFPSNNIIITLVDDESYLPLMHTHRSADAKMS